MTCCKFLSLYLATDIGRARIEEKNGVEVEVDARDTTGIWVRLPLSLVKTEAFT